MNWLFWVLYKYEQHIRIVKHMYNGISVEWGSCGWRVRAMKRLQKRQLKQLYIISTTQALKSFSSDQIHSVSLVPSLFIRIFSLFLSPSPFFCCFFSALMHPMFSLWCECVWILFIFFSLSIFLCCCLFIPYSNFTTHIYTPMDLSPLSHI